MNYFSFQHKPKQQTFITNSLLFICLLNLFAGCKKADEHADLISNQPYLITSTVGLGGLFNIQFYQYQQNILVGDTMTLVGRLFLSRPGSSIQIGNSTAIIVQKGKAATNNIDARTGLEDSLEIARFIITKEMGTGSNISLTCYANGYSVQGPPLTITLINSGNRRTDTTLVVDKIGGWLPGNLAAFQVNPSPFVNNGSVAGDGTLYFDNLNGIFKLSSGQVTPVIVTGGNLSDQQQSAFSIDFILSSVISQDGNSLYFSAVVNENVPPAEGNVYVLRLCKMDMASQQIRTLNRTTMLQGAGTYQEQLGPYSGNANALKIAANNLHIDVAGNIWFTNIYFPTSNLTNPYSGSTYNSTTDWYPLLQPCSYTSQPFGALFNVCRMDVTGKVSSLMEANWMYAFDIQFYQTPGPVFSDVSSFTLTGPDGSVAYGLKQPTFGSNMSLNQYVLSQGDIEKTINGLTAKFNFISFDTAAATRLAPNGNFPPPYINTDLNFNACLLLPDNDLLYAAHSSLYAYNFDNGSVYCYAGAENQNTSVQTQLTGKAKYVNFENTSDQLRLIGVDKTGAVYYCTGGTVSYSAGNDLTNGVVFYKIHPAN